jgi:eukaryotic-like serine/threonine-protein kinase
MAEVWVGQLMGDLGFSRLVAIKTIRSDYAEDPSFRRSFFEEARLAARLRHANVVEVSDLGEEGPILFQVMEYVEGDTLGNLVRLVRDNDRGKPHGAPVSIVSRVVSDALAGLHAAHETVDEQGVPLNLVHRDVSPQNILVGLDGVARLGDFGVAKALGRLSFETEAGQIRGKPGYLAPEQIERRPLDRRCDLFAMGIVLWESFTGARLFDGDAERRPLAKPSDPSVPDVRIFAPGLPPRIADVTMRALSRRPDDRYPTAQDMRDALEAAARDSDAIATSKDVSAWVSELCGPRLRELRSRMGSSRSSGEGPRPASLPPPLPLRPPDPPGSLGGALISEPPPLIPTKVVVRPPTLASSSPPSKEPPPLAALIRDSIPPENTGEAFQTNDPTVADPPLLKKLRPPPQKQYPIEDTTEEMGAVERAAGVRRSNVMKLLAIALTIGVLVSLSMLFGKEEAPSSNDTPAPVVETAPPPAEAAAAPVEAETTPVNEHEDHAALPQPETQAAPPAEPVIEPPAPSIEKPKEASPPRERRSRAPARASHSAPKKPQPQQQPASLRPRFTNPYK